MSAANANCQQRQNGCIDNLLLDVICACHKNLIRRPCVIVNQAYDLGIVKFSVIKIHMLAIISIYAFVVWISVFQAVCTR